MEDSFTTPNQKLPFLDSSFTRDSSNQRTPNKLPSKSFASEEPKHYIRIDNAPIMKYRGNRATKKVFHQKNNLHNQQMTFDDSDQRSMIISRGQHIKEVQEENIQLRKNFLQNFYQENNMKKVGYKLCKNIDQNSLKAMIHQPAQSNRQAQNSQDLKYSYQNFKFEDSVTPARNNPMRIPQKEAFIQNTVSGEVLRIKPPDLQIEQSSNYRENYFKILSKDDKSFNIKKGEFTHQIDSGLKKVSGSRESSRDHQKSMSLNPSLSKNLLMSKDSSITQSSILNKKSMSIIHQTSGLYARTRNPQNSNPYSRESSPVLTKLDKSNLHNKIISQQDSLPQITNKNSFISRKQSALVTQDSIMKDDAYEQSKAFYELSIKKLFGSNNEQSLKEIKSVLSPIKFRNNLKSQLKYKEMHFDQNSVDNLSFALNEIVRFEEKMGENITPISKFYCRGNIPKNKYWLKRQV